MVLKNYNTLKQLQISFINKLQSFASKNGEHPENLLIEQPLLESSEGY